MRRLKRLAPIGCWCPLIRRTLESRKSKIEIGSWKLETRNSTVETRSSRGVYDERDTEILRCAQNDGEGGRAAVPLGAILQSTSHQPKIQNPKSTILLVLLLVLLIGQAAPAQTKPSTAESFDNLAKRAAAAREASRTEEAVALYKQCLRLKPRWAEGWWDLGTLYYDADHYAEAVPAFKNVVGLNPKMGPAYALLGLSEFETHDYKNALLHLQHGRALGLGGNEELVNVTRYHEALLLNVTGEFEAAMELLTSLVGRGVTSENVKVALGLTVLRVPLLPTQVDPSKDALIHAAGEIGELTALSNFDQADVAFQQMLKDYPNTPFLHYAYGTMLTILTRYDEAEREFKEEIKVTPESSLPYMQLAYVYLRVNRNQDALSPARQAVKLAPQSFAAHYLLGRSLLELGEASEAVKELENARRLGPFSPEVRYSLARAYAKVKRTQDAARERAEFTRLNDLLSRKQQQSEAQSYRSTSDRGSVQPGAVREAPPK